MPKPLHITSNKPHTKRRESENAGIVLIAHLLEQHYPKECKVRLDESPNLILQSDDKGETEDGYFELVVDQGKPRIYIQSKANQASCRFDKRDRLIIEDVGYFQNGFVYFFPYIEKQIVYFTILKFEDFYDPKVTQINKNKENFISATSNGDFLHKLENEVERIRSARTILYGQDDERLAEVIKYDKSKDKIKPSTPISVLTHSASSEAERILEMTERVKKLGNNQSTKNLVEELKENPTLQSRFFEILDNIGERKLTHALDFVIQALISEYSSQIQRDELKKQEWLDARRNSVMILNKLTPEKNREEDVQKQYLELLTTIDLSNDEDQQLVGLVLIGLSKRVTIVEVLWKRVLVLCKDIKLLNSFVLIQLTDFAIKQFDKQPSNASLLLKGIIEISSFEENNESYHVYIIDDFFTQSISSRKHSSIITNLLHVGLVVSANETQSVEITPILHYYSNGYSNDYLNYMLGDRGGILYFDLLWKHLENSYDDRDIIELFDSWLNGDWYESLVFFVYRYCHKHHIKYEKVETLKTTIAALSGTDETRYWLSDKTTITSHFHTVTDDENILDWQKYNQDTRKNYLNFELNEWAEDIEYTLTHTQQSDWGFLIMSVLKSYILSNKTNVTDLLTFFSEYDYKANTEIKNSYLLALVNILIQGDLLVNQKVRILVDLVNSKVLALNGEVSKSLLWFIRQNFEQLKSDTALVDNVFVMIDDFLSSYTLEGTYQKHSNSGDGDAKNSLVDIGTLLNIPNGIGYMIMITQLWSYYLTQGNIQKLSVIASTINTGFETDKPLARESILGSLGHASGSIFKKYWAKGRLIDKIIISTLKVEYDYNTFNFILHLISRSALKAKKYDVNLREWANNFVRDFEEDKNSTRLIHLLYGIEVWTGVFDTVIKDIFDGSSDQLKTKLSQEIIIKAEVYRASFKNNRDKLNLEKRLLGNLNRAITHMKKNTVGDCGDLVRFLNPIHYGYKDAESIESFFDYWLGEKKSIFVDILKITKDRRILIGLEFINKKHWQTNQKLRYQIINFFALLFEVKLFGPHSIGIQKTLLVITEIVIQDSLYTDKNVIGIRNNVLKFTKCVEIIALNDLLMRNQ